MHQKELAISRPAQDATRSIVRCAAGIQRKLHGSIRESPVFAQLRGATREGKEKKLRDPLLKLPNEPK